MAPDAGIHAGPGRAQLRGSLVVVADGQQEVGRGLLEVPLHGRLEQADGVGESAAGGELAAAQEGVQRRDRLERLGGSTLAVPAGAVARAFEASGAAEVVG